MVKRIMGLCAGRHELPAEVEGYVFDNIVDPTDLITLADTAAQRIGQVDELVLYVTGLTVALVEVINFCQWEGIRLTLMHFDRESGQYFPQRVS